MKSNKIDKLFERLYALEDAHPDMIWKFHVASGINLGKDDRTYVYVKCVCPEHYSYWQANAETPYCKLSAMYTLEDGLYTLAGAARKVTALERLDWTRFDEVAAKAQAERKEIVRKVEENSALAVG